MTRKPAPFALNTDDTLAPTAMEGFTSPDSEAPPVDWEGFLEVAMLVVDSMVITQATA